MLNKGLFLLLIAVFSTVNAQDPYSLYVRGVTNFNQGNYEVAKNYFQDAVKTAQSEFGTKNNKYARYLNYLALSHHAISNYNKAESLYVKSISIFESTSNKNPNEFVDVSNNLARLYLKMGIYDKAEEYFNKVLRYISTNDKDYPKVINSMSILYRKTGREEKADSLLTYLDKSIEEGNDIEEEANYLNTKASAEFSRNNFEKADSLLQRAIALVDSAYGRYHPDYSKYINNLATIYKAKKSYDKAESLYLETLSLKSKLGKNHPSYAITLSNLAKLYTEKNDYNLAETYYEKLNTSLLNQIENYFPSLSENEKKQFWAKIKVNSDFYYSFAAIRMRDNPNIIGDIFNYQIQTKALLLRSISSIRKSIYESGNEDLINKFKQWQKTRENLANIYSLGLNQINEKGINVDSLEQKINSLEKELSRNSENFRKNLTTDELTWKSIQENLNEDEAVIEIVRYNYTSKENPNSVYYLALIITSETKSHPEVVILKNGEELEGKYLTNYLRSIKSDNKDSYSYRQYWEKINSKIEDKRKIYLSPDGVYNKVNIQTMVNSEGIPLLESKSISLVSNSKDIITIKEEASETESGFDDICLFGAPRFQYEKDSSKPSNKPDTDEINEELGVFIKYLDNLPGTLKEINEINKLFHKKEINTQVYTDSTATESNLKKSADASILHIATHGFFLENVNFDTEIDLESNNGNGIQNPLLRSGLVFAGAKNKYFDKAERNFQSDDGVLTAFEAMNLNLNQTELVVLSACETAGGEVVNGEGVYGLQRAFLAAGSNSIIMSLWKVDDTITKTFMTYFYENILTGFDKNEALYQAKKKIKDQYKSPKYWGAFVMINQS